MAPATLFHALRGSLLALLAAAIVSPAPVRAQTPGDSPPAGHLRAIAAQRVTSAPIIDGNLSDPLWALGFQAEDFWVADLQQPASDQTRVVVLYDDQALYVAFTCLDTRPDLIRATQIARDGAPGMDDRVTVELDPYHNHRSVSRFTVTARGTQSDEIAGGRAGKVEWKGAWRAAARRTADGWTAEIAIPFEMLEFEPGTATFGVNFLRYQNRTREWSEWANLTPQRLPEEAGHLTGLDLRSAAAANRLALMQYVSGAARTDATDARAGQLGTGVDIRYQWRGTMTTVVTARPDFSDADADVPGVGFTYTERFLSDRRPFFQEGESFFGDSELFYSGRIETFDVGGKTFGRVDDYQIGLLATTDADTGRSDFVGRVVREVGSTFNMSATVVGTSRDAFDNNTLQLQAGGRVGRNVRVEGAVAKSSSDGGPGDGTRRRGEIAYETSHWYSGGWVDYTDSGYFPADGFIAEDLIGTIGRGAYGGYNRAFGRGWMRRADASVSYDVRDTTSGLRQRETASIYAGAETFSDVRLNAGATIGSYRPTGPAPGEWTDTINDDRFYLASAYYQSPTGQFGGGAQYSWGFVGRQDYATVMPTVWVAPSPHVSLAYSFERATHDRVERQHVLSGTWDISGAQSLAARWVDDQGGYYRVSYRRAITNGVDAYGVYTSDPYDPGRVNVKLVWTWMPLQAR